MKLLSLIVVAVQIGCSDDMLTAPVGTEFRIGIGEVAQITHTPLAVRFVRVASDNRCPAGALCTQTIGAGNAQVDLEASLDGEQTTLTLNTTAGVTQMQVGSWHIELTGLTPLRQIGHVISDKDYRASILVYGDD